MLAQLLRKSAPAVPAKVLRILGNFWPPFLGSGIKIEYVDPGYREIHVLLKYGWYNKNYVGTQFGGSIYAMTDPFYMVMLINNLGKGYVVWDKAASIEFKKPGRSKLSVVFSLTDEEILEIKNTVNKNGEHFFTVVANVKDNKGGIVARVEKVVFVRKKDYKKKING